MTTTGRPNTPNEFLLGVRDTSRRPMGLDAASTPSIWDTTIQDSLVSAGFNPASDAGNFQHDDLTLLQELGVGAHQFSIAWSSVMPDGSGPVNHHSLDGYDRLVDELLDRDIVPMPMLHRWDLPQVLQDDGGWVNRRVVDSFIDFVGAVAARLGDRVERWMTMSRPCQQASQGYILGAHPPREASQRLGFAAAHHMLVAHGHAVQILRAHSPGAKVGIELDVSSSIVNSLRSGDELNLWCLETIASGQWPAELIDTRPWSGAEVNPGDLELIGAPLDMLGVFVPFGEDIGEYVTSIDNTFPFDSYFVSCQSAPDSPPRGQVPSTDARSRWLADQRSQLDQLLTSGYPIGAFLASPLLDGFDHDSGRYSTHGLVAIDPISGERTPKPSFDALKLEAMRVRTATR